MRRPKETHGAAAREPVADPWPDEQAWVELVEKRGGTRFTPARRRLLRNGLEERMRVLGSRTSLEYYKYVSGRPPEAGEWGALLELLVNRETRFFRSGPSFDALRTRILPQIVRQKQKQGSRLRLWSAGCSTGEEAYSMAMAAVEAADPQCWEIRILGSDISRAALETARQGLYPARRLSRLPEAWRRHFSPLEDRPGGFYQVQGGLRSLVEFAAFNLIDPDSYGARPEDVIFCQNVLIYFPANARRRIVLWLTAKLNPDGCLLLAPGELEGIQIPGMETVWLEDLAVYRRAA